jgi:hypothetical protein
MERSFNNKKGDMFDDLDLEEIGVTTKHMNLVNYAQGFIFMHKAWKRSVSPIEFGTLMSNAANNFGESLELMSSNIEIMTSLAEVLFGSQRFQEAEAYYKRAMEIDPTNCQTLYKYAIMLKHFKVNKPLEADEYPRSLTTKLIIQTIS